MMVKGEAGNRGNERDKPHVIAADEPFSLNENGRLASAYAVPRKTNE
jgi:hypothetical protein